VNPQFIFFCTNIGNETLLKEEIAKFYPELTLSYSRKGFITFKNTGNIKYDLKSIGKLDVAFATRTGICLGKARPEDLKETLEKTLKENEIAQEKCMIHSFSVNTDYTFHAQEILETQVNEHTPINKVVIDLIALGEKEVWFGIHSVGKNTTPYPNSQSSIELPQEAPSRGYLKIAQAVEQFNINFTANDNWIDFGSAPGGASYYLLEKGCKVWGVDPGKMNKVVTRNRRYQHLSKSVQDLSQEELPDRIDIHWIHADLNLNAKQSIKEVLRIAKKYNHNLRGMIFTVPVVRKETISEIEKYEDQFYDWGFTNITSRQLPSHKQEYVIIAKR